MKKKFISYILAFTLAIPIIVGVMTGCKSNAKIDKTTSKDIYAFSATTSASYLYNSNLASSQQNGSSVSNTKMQNSVSTVAEQTRPNNITEEDTKSIKQYINTFESYMLNDGVNQNSSKPNETDGEYAKYNIKLTSSFPDGKGGTINFVMYYDEIATETNKEIEEDEEEIEVNTTLKGVMLFGDEVFDVSGEKSVETEGNETETEITFTTKSKSNPLNYVKVNQSYEQGEIEYNYSIFEDGKLVSKTKVDWEKDDEDNQKELTVSFKSLTTNDVLKTKFSIQNKQVNGKEGFEIKVQKDNIKTKFDVEITETSYKFIYSDNNFEIIDK